MKARHKALHDEGWQSRVGKEGDAYKFDDVRMAKGAHQFTFLRELSRGFADEVSSNLVWSRKIPWILLAA